MPNKSKRSLKHKKPVLTTECKLDILKSVIAGLTVDLLLRAFDFIVSLLFK